MRVVVCMCVFFGGTVQCCAAHMLEPIGAPNSLKARGLAFKAAAVHTLPRFCGVQGGHADFSPLGDGGVGVVPRPPEKLGPDYVVRCVDHLSDNAGQASLSQGRAEPKPPDRDSGHVHEDDVDAGDVQRHPVSTAWCA